MSIQREEIIDVECFAVNHNYFRLKTLQNLRNPQRMFINSRHQR